MPIFDKSISVASMKKGDLSRAIQEVLGNPSYRDAARRFQRTIAQAHGLDRAADVLERAFQFVDESSEMVWETSNSLAEKYPSPALLMDRTESQ
jgi:hypothetical protein